MSILRVENIVKSYGNRRAVDDVSFSLASGEILSIVGESGCGKTTLAKIIMGVLPADGGRVTASAGLQMVFQDPNNSLDPLWNVRSILKEALWDKKGSFDDQMRAMLQAVGLPQDILNRFPHEFSGGGRQRIALARALLARPKILLLDEATSALDTLAQKQIMVLLKGLKRDFDLSYVFISHNLRLVRHFSDKIMVMYRGKIVEQGAAAAVLQAPAHPYTQQLLRAAFYKT